jgi:hypothetical protein
MPSVQEFESWLTTGFAASKLGKSRQGVVWLCENRKLRAARTALGWLVDPNDVERYASEHGIEIKGEE